MVPTREHFAPPEHLSVSGGISNCHNWRSLGALGAGVEDGEGVGARGMLLAPSGHKPEVQLNSLEGTEQPSPKKKVSSPNIYCTELEKPGLSYKP